MLFGRVKTMFPVITACGVLFNIIWMFNQGLHVRLFKGYAKTVRLVCPNISISKTSLPLTALVSYPGAGNTLTRHLLEHITGVATGSDFFDKSLFKGGFKGEMFKDGHVIAVKTHSVYNSKRHAYSRAILVVRNPYRAILADFNRYYSKSHIGVVSLNIFLQNWHLWFKENSTKMFELYNSWITALKDVLVIFYENLQENLTKELERVCVFLTNMSCHTQCALQGGEDTFHRPQTQRLPVTFFFSSAQINFFNKEIERLHVLLTQYNHSFYDVMSYKLPASTTKIP